MLNLFSLPAEGDFMKHNYGNFPYRKLYLLLLCISAVVFCVFLFLYYGFQQALMQSVSTLNNDFVQQVNSTAATAESVLQNFSAQIFNIRSVRKLRTYQELSNAEMIEGIRSLNDFTASSAIIDSIYVYNGKRDYVYSTVSSGAVSDRADLFLDQAAVDLMRNKTADQRLKPLPRFSTSSSSTVNQDMFSILVFDLDTQGQPEDNVLMMNISSAWFSDLYFGKNEDAAMIVDEDGKLITLSSSVSEAQCLSLLPMLMETLRASPGHGDCVLDLNGSEKLLCFFTGMSNRNWYYVRMVPYSKYLTGLMDVQGTTYLFLVLTFVALVVGIIVMAFRLWMPFHYIRTSLSDIDSAPEQKKDPVEQLNLLISRSVDSTRINEALKRMLKDSVLSGLLLGKEKSEGPIAEEYDMCLTDATPLQPVFISSNRSEHLMSIVRPRCPHSECVSVPGEHTVLLLQPQDPALVMQLCAQIVQKNPRWYVVIGRTVESWGDLPAAYNEMSEAYRLRFLRPEGSSRCIGCLPALDGTTLLADQKSGQILEAVKAGKDEAVKAAYDEFLLLLNGKTYQSVVFALTHLAGDMLKLYYEYFPDTLPPRKVALKEFGDRLDEMNSLEEINGYFLSRFAQMTEKVRQDRKNRQGQLLDEVLRMIQSRYTDSDLSLQTLADAFHMSPAYLGRLFRQAQGQSVADCITGLRVEEAKRLLRETDIKIKDFGPMIGVENVQYFFVQFKQATGMTPKQYRVRSRRTDGRENQSP